MVDSLIVGKKLYITIDEIADRYKNRFAIQITNKETNTKDLLKMNFSDNNYKVLVFDCYTFGNDFISNLIKDLPELEECDIKLIDYKNFNADNDTLVLNPNPIDHNQFLVYVYTYINKNEEIIDYFTKDPAFSTAIISLFNNILRKNDANTAEIVLNLIYSTFSIINAINTSLSKNED